MHALLIIIHVLVAFALVVAILLQSGHRGGGLASAFGGSGGGAIFGGRGAAPFLAKLTAGLGIVFALTCIGLNLVSPRTSTEVKSATIEEMERRAKETSQAAALPEFGVPEQKATPDSSE